MSEGQLFELEQDEELRVEVDCAKVRILIVFQSLRKINNFCNLQVLWAFNGYIKSK